MKNFIAALLLIAGSLCHVMPLAAQRAPRMGRERVPRQPQVTAFATVEAFSDGEGVLVRWRMVSERPTAGYNVMRVGKISRPVNPSLVLGSAARSSLQTTYGGTYEFFDPRGSVGSTYYVQAVQMDGTLVTSITAGAVYVEDIESVAEHGIDAHRASARMRVVGLTAEETHLNDELKDIVAANQQTADPDMQKWVAAQPGAKISVKRSGFYRIQRADLEAAGFAVNSDPTKWRLFTDGVEQAITVGPNGDFVEFFGKSLDTIESDTRMYYLIAGNVPGKRIRGRAVRRAAGTTAAQNYVVTSEKKEKQSYINTIINGDEDNFWGGVLINVPYSIPFTLTGIDTSVASATIHIKLQGWSLTPHTVRVRLNGQLLSNATGTGQEKFSLTAAVPTSQLVEGTNNLELTSTTSSDFSLFDSVTVTYKRRYSADQNRISFATPGYRPVDIRNFDAPNVRLYDMSVDGEPVLLTNVPVVRDGAAYTIRMPSYRPFIGYALADGAMLSPARVASNTPSELSSTTNAADLIIVSHSAPDFLAASETWADYRRAQGFTAKVVDIADVFDEFNYGVANPDAINSFLKYAHGNWQTPPRYVLLMGDASYDPRNYTGAGFHDLVPTKMVSLIYGESGSDEALADFNNDGLAEMAIGRIPVRSSAAITVVYNKTVTFETPGRQGLSRGVVFAYDTPTDNSYPPNYFRMASESLRAELPQSVPSTYIAKNAENAQPTLLQLLSGGPFIVNYSGHGSAGLWATSSFFGLSNVSQVTNNVNPSIYSMLTCLNGYFLEPNRDSLSEGLLKSQVGGAAVAWASTTETTADFQMEMALRFYNQVGAGQISRMGDLVKDAKAAVSGGRDVKFSWALLGDPMLKVR